MQESNPKTQTPQNTRFNRNIRKYMFWIILALPALWIWVAFLNGAKTYGQVIHLTGQISAGLFLITLAVTPLRRIWPSAMWPRQLMAARRALGVASFGYAAFHTATYLERKIPLGRVPQDAMRPEYLTGWIAFIIFILLAATSNTASVKKLGKTWQVLHRSTYAAAALTALHWGLATFEYSLPLIFAGLWLGLEAARWMKRPKRQ